MVGRTADALISVASDKVSRRHAILIVSGNRVVLQDQGSKNGTYVGALRVEQPVELKDGDRIAIGPIVLNLPRGRRRGRDRVRVPGVRQMLSRRDLLKSSLMLPYLIRSSRCRDSHHKQR